jgi:hypothetical protein
MLKDVTGLIEKFNSKVCIQILHVHKRTSNYAVRFELGRLPLFVNIICRVLKYYINICKRDENSVVKIALKLHMTCKDSWYTFVKYIVENLGFKLSILSKSNINGSNNSVFNKLKTIIQDIYRSKIAECSKLTLYSVIKRKLTRESYLNLPDPNLRKHITQIRLSCHKLPIETGRYNNISRQDRLCTLCKYEVGSEQHCLIECYHPILSTIRNKYLSAIFKINPMLKYLPRDCLFKYILLFTDKSILQLSAKYIHDVLTIYPNRPS